MNNMGLTEQQMKAVELLAIGKSTNEVAMQIEVCTSTVRTWKNVNKEFKERLDSATELFGKACALARTRKYRYLNEKIMNEICKKINENKLENCDLFKLIQMLEKTNLVIKTDIDASNRTPVVAAQQNNYNFNIKEGEEFVEHMHKALGALGRDAFEDAMYQGVKDEKDGRSINICHGGHIDDRRLPEWIDTGWYGFDKINGASNRRTG